GVAKPENANSMYGLRYSEFVVPLVKTVQEQQKFIDSLIHIKCKRDSVVKVLQKQLSQLQNIIGKSNNNMSATTGLNSQSISLSNADVVVLNQNQPNPFAEQT